MMHGEITQRLPIQLKSILNHQHRLICKLVHLASSLIIVQSQM